MRWFTGNGIYAQIYFIRKIKELFPSDLLTKAEKRNIIFLWYVGMNNAVQGEITDEAEYGCNYGATRSFYV